MVSTHEYLEFESTNMVLRIDYVSDSDPGALKSLF